MAKGTTISDYNSSADAYTVGMANYYADQYGIPQNLFQALITKESNWNSTAKNPGSTAYGLTQLTKPTATDMGVDPYSGVDAQLEGGAKYLAQQYDKFGNWNDALAAYNQGPGNYSNSAGQAYASDVMKIAGSDDSTSTTANTEEREKNQSGFMAFIQNQIGNAAFIILGIVIVAIALMSNKTVREGAVDVVASTTV